MGTRERVLQATRQLFDSEGLEGLSMRAVARRIGVTPMAIYKHFVDKQALVDALVLDGLAEWADRVAAIEEAPPLVWLERLDRVFLDFALGSPHRFEAAFLLPSRRARQFPDDFAAGRSPAAAIIVPVIQRAMDEGLLAGESALEIWITTWGLSQGLVTLYRAHRFAGGEDAFRSLYHRAMKRMVLSFQPETTT